jgi:hypothetical protein
MTETIDYHKFVDAGLEQLGMRILLVTEDLLKENIRKFSKFINDGYKEYYDVYKWREHADDEYLMNPLQDKFKFSFCILDTNENIRFINFTSVVEGKLNNHFTFASKDTRSMNLAKFHMIKLCRTGVDNGYAQQVGYWPKNNNRSIILYLKLGWQISYIREDGLLIMLADNALIAKNAYGLLRRYDSD